MEMIFFALLTSFDKSLMHVDIQWVQKSQSDVPVLLKYHAAEL